MFELLKNAIWRIFINITSEFDDLSANLPQLHLLKLIKVCFVNRILTIKEFDVIISIMYDKLDALTNLNQIFSQKNEETKMFQRELVKIKQYLCEIFILHLIMKNDEAALKLIRTSSGLSQLFSDFRSDNWY
jgi:hypothetical protein